jgi:FAD/FMN-containing dehydrogenase
VFPTSTEDVVVAMRAIYAADSHYAVRGGGHSAMPGWNTYAFFISLSASPSPLFMFISLHTTNSSTNSIFSSRIQNGVLIDFSHMKSYSYNSSSDTITMQPGVLWGEVCDGLEKQGVAPVGGRERCISCVLPSGYS